VILKPGKGRWGGRVGDNAGATGMAGRAAAGAPALAELAIPFAAPIRLNPRA
jgi:hypothetical protein